MIRKMAAIFQTRGANAKMQLRFGNSKTFPKIISKKVFFKRCPVYYILLFGSKGFIFIKWSTDYLRWIRQGFWKCVHTHVAVNFVFLLSILYKPKYLKNRKTIGNQRIAITNVNIIIMILNNNQKFYVKIIVKKKNWKNNIGVK